MSQLLHGLLNLALQAPDAAAEVANAATKAAAETVEAATEIVPAAQASGTSPFVFTLLTLFILVLPFVLAYVAAKALKVQEWTGRLAVVFFTLAVGASPFLTSLMKGEPLDKRFRLGIDLAGGTNMVFQVKPEGKEVNDQVMDRMVGAVSQRINRSGTEEVTVRKVGRDRIEVIVPGEDPQSVDEIKRQITRLGSLEFFICADSTDQQIVRMANELDKSQTILEMDGEIVARWIPAFEKNGVPKLLDESVIRRSVQKTREVNGKMENYDTEEYLLLVEPPEESVTGKYLRSAMPDFDQNGAIVVSFNFDQTGGYLFGQLTGRNAPKPGLPPRKLAIVLDKKVFSAPNINEQITNRGQISGGAGGFTRSEAEELSNVLNAGALEVPIDPKPLSEATVDPTLGADVRNKGVSATLISGLAVVIFMLAYYRFSGIVAVISLMLNLLLTIAAMVAINATFTLPGIAGIVLTIGMAVDANVLIYERMREEIAKGSSIRMAIQNGFEKAFITIFDANITTLLTAVILFAIGTDQIKGFAVTLFLGLAISMYTVLFVGRLMFDIAEKRRWLKKLNMSQLIGETRIDFLKHRVMWCTISLVVIGVGLIAFFIRGEKNYDIDFTGGTMVSFQTTEPQKTDDVSAALKEQFKEEFTLERLTLGADSQEGIGNYFRLRSTEKDDHSPGDTEAAGKKSAEQRVRDMVYESFKDHPAIKLRMVSLEFSEVAPVVIADGDESAQAISRMQFKGGSSSDLTFSEEVASGTVNDMLAAALGAIKKEDGNGKYQVTEGLLGLEGTEGSGTSVGERSVRKFNKLTVRVAPEIAADDLKSALTSMQSTLASTPLFDEVNTFASAVASEMKESALIAILLSIVAISAYIWFRFQNVVFGLAAVVALVHDVLVSLGFVAMASWVSGTSIGDLFLIDDFRINLPMIAAFLTLVGYSLNDTIVMFDRIREVRGKNPAITISMVNLALNQTLGRTILTATTVFIVVFILYAFGGAGVHGFAWCLLVGCIAGTYSSIYIASPILIWALNRVQGTVKA
jgi:SecD/SecF fusion protein